MIITFTINFVPNLEQLRIISDEEIPSFVERMLSKLKHLRKLRLSISHKDALHAISQLTE
jgi:hypothetical protein